MSLALQLAEKGRFTTHPNPRVGCVLVKDDQVIGQGWHHQAGQPHAEINALADAKAQGNATEGATAYVTLEPCSHHGRTGPCCQALAKAKVVRVVAAMQDPNPQVAGKGLGYLQNQGIITTSGVQQAAARALNVGFLSRMEKGRPWIRLKLAMSLDGRTAMDNGQSKWITSAAARADVQRMRAEADAILTATGTLLADDPKLDVRDEGAFQLPELHRQPLRVIVDSKLQTPHQARIFESNGQVLIASAIKGEHPQAEVVQLPQQNSQRVDLIRLMDLLGQREINQIHVEAGPVLAASLLKAGLVDELVVYMAAKLMGNTARGLFDLPELQQMADAIDLQIQDIRAIGKDWRITATVL
ncbi:bifunctional diaminohydroxyphosphoribosylaminopyrimidine deaminase/5-amino-6-(5-phosphoribosylamino)uracil reductase RibD [Pelagibaculum spongiae]|uniref:Riboflavin biosynthesis protein RibD n=2 Tax=Pelagibaculum spongiae TaxID=2080658 RepID=A0A2V1GZS7_9GAMM|nr:bifunctional diaminohydroxyphosphoribosylaminopyrimidine deaminase/5-amino-6-(5-phosphoribosylamino)uracil reductase RibD [Pelagibaculum spongiae]